MSKQKGTVISFFPKRGFGFIKPNDGGEKLFAHWSKITSSDKWPKLEKGEVVEFTAGEDEDARNAAVDITFEGGAEANHGDETKHLSKFRATGTVKFFDKKGYGFIELSKAITWPVKMAAGSDVYVSRDELDMAEESRVSLWKGMEVEFNVYQSEDKEKGSIGAANVTAPGGESLVFQRPERSERSKKGPKASGKGKGKGKKSSIGVKKTIVKTITKPVSKGSGKSTGKSTVASAGKSAGKSAVKGAGKSVGKSVVGKSAGKSAVKLVATKGGKSSGKSSSKGGKNWR